MKVILKDVRLAFPALFEPQAIEDGQPKYGLKGVIDPSNAANVKALDDAMMAVAKEKWGDKADAIFKKLVKTGKPKNIEVCFVKEPYANASGDTYDGFEDMFYVSASNSARPYVSDRQNQPVTAADGLIYAGCYVHMSIELWAQDNKWGKAVRATLKSVMFARDGGAFAGGTPGSPDDLADLAEGVNEPALA